MSDQEQNLIKFFTQCPNIILYGLPHMTIQDKWALLALVGICRNRSRGISTLKELEGPYKLSLREIGALTGIKHSALRKTAGKNPREGTLDRLQALGYITLLEGKPINETTGNEGRSQTYLYMHLEKLWQDNLAFSESWRMPSNKLVDPNTFTTIAESTVHHVTDTVHHVDNDGHVVNSNGHMVNSNGHVVNSIGHVVNHTVHDSSTKSELIHSNTDNTLKDERDTNSDQQQQTHLSTSANQSQQQPERKERQGQSRSRKASTSRDIVLTLQGEHILDLYDEFKGRKAIRNEATLLAANGLGEVVRSDADFLDVLKAIAYDPFLKQKQVRTDLDFVYRKYDGFLDIVEQARGRQPPGACGGPTDYNEVAGMTDEQRAAYKRTQEEKLQQMQPPGVDRQALMNMKPEERIALLQKMRERQSVSA
jgi:hypothetical protein